MTKHWNEPAEATSPRGWLCNPGVQLCEGFYLDYGPDHYRSPHEYCGGPSDLCRECQPGNILAVHVGGNYEARRSHRWCESVDEARSWLEEKSG
jgi:hypothetical protein